MRPAFVQLAVRDRAASVAWYRAALGLREVMSDEAGDFTLLELLGWRLALKGGSPSQGVLLAFEVDDLAAEVRRLRGLGVAIEGEAKASPEGYERVKASDPDGNAVTLFAWRPTG